jgi:hypothetical protein
MGWLRHPGGLAPRYAARVTVSMSGEDATKGKPRRREGNAGAMSEARRGTAASMATRG